MTIQWQVSRNTNVGQIARTQLFVHKRQTIGARIKVDQVYVHKDFCALKEKMASAGSG